MNDLADRYSCSVKTLQRHFENFQSATKISTASPYPVALTFDGTFFSRQYGLLIYRAEGKNIYWQEIESENLAIIEQGLRHLIGVGWQFSSITIDGRKGTVSLLKRLFPDAPIQLCIFHQKATIRRYLTTKPKTMCGKEIRVLVSFLSYIDEPLFLDCLSDIKNRYDAFLKERNEQKQFKHKKLRSALRSLTTNAPLFYTYKKHPKLKIPSTTNSCDGSFTHWKNKVKIHRGLKQKRKQKMIQFLLANS